MRRRSKSMSVWCSVSGKTKGAYRVSLKNFLKSCLMIMTILYSMCGLVVAA